MSKTRSTTKRPFDLVDHFDQEAHPVDAAVGRAPKVRALRERVRVATRPFEKALGPRRKQAWLPLEAALVELAGTREELFLDAGFEHGHAAGRAERMTSRPRFTPWPPSFGTSSSRLAALAGWPWRPCSTRPGRW